MKDLDPTRASWLLATALAAGALTFADGSALAQSRAGGAASPASATRNGAKAAIHQADADEPAGAAEAAQDAASGQAQSGSGSSDAALAPSSGQADQIVVFGRAQALVGTADAASEGAVGGTDLAVRPLVRTAEMLEVVPGLIAAQHSGSGKANQYFLRGFNLDHGTDFSAYVDGVPWNLRTHGHGQGYLDVNGLIPEIVEQIQYRKGPYRADVGDFSLAASAKITTVSGWDRPFLSLETGGYGWKRLAGGSTSKVGGGSLSIAGEIKGYDGPWELAEHLRHQSVWSKYERQTDFGQLAVSLSGYHATWRPTEQIPERAIGTPVCANEYCAIDPTAVGETSRWIASAQLFGDDWDATGYLQYYDWHMLSNPTYDFQIGQFDRRWTLGGKLDRTLISTDKLELVIGGEMRYDDIGKVGVNHTQAGALVYNISDNSVNEPSLGVYTEATWQPTDRLRLLGGLRGDIYGFDVTAVTATSYAGRVTDNQLSPKIGLAYRLTDEIELYGNWGRGFHSNDARGVVNEAAPVPGLAQGTGYEAGARFELGALKLTAAYWWLNLGSELKFVGDSNAVQPFGASRRRGYELTAFWRPLDWLGVDVSYASSRARFVDNPNGPYIDGSIESAGEIGLSGAHGPWEIGARLRYLGPYALLPDNSKRASSEKQVNLRTAYTIRRVTLYGELLNALGAHGKDIVYDYPAYVAGLDPVGLTSKDIDCTVVNCRMSRAEEPRTLRFGVKLELE